MTQPVELLDLPCAIGMVCVNTKQSDRLQLVETLPAAGKPIFAETDAQPTFSINTARALRMGARRIEAASKSKR